MFDHHALKRDCHSEMTEHLNVYFYHVTGFGLFHDCSSYFYTELSLRKNNGYLSQYFLQLVSWTIDMAIPISSAATGVILILIGIFGVWAAFNDNVCYFFLISTFIVPQKYALKAYFIFNTSVGVLLFCLAFMWLIDTVSPKVPCYPVDFFVGPTEAAT
jgi:hypothetical protein